MKALREGQYIKHFQYGFGVVTESDADRTSIDFDLHGLKKFVTGLMVVELSDEKPPQRPRSQRAKKASGKRAASPPRRAGGPAATEAGTGGK